MATEQCVRPAEKTPHETSHEHHLSSGHIPVVHESKSLSEQHGHNQQIPVIHAAQHGMTKNHAESKTPSHGIHAPQHRLKNRIEEHKRDAAVPGIELPYYTK
ncbi:hypothetical protein V6N11_062791 [Hibiscus sabdariffa]|uniref:Allergen n=1 Tax=Hibiscus sabdariffa TaxID=183260 RepID=A0ABR2NPU0_9ROSI